MGRPLKRQRGDTVTKTPPTISTVLKVGEMMDESFRQGPVAPNTSLEQLLAPLDESVFLSSLFRTYAVHVPALNPSRMKQISSELYELEVESILRETSSENIFVWIQQENGLIQSIEVSDADAAAALYHAGHAIYCRAPPSLEQSLVASLLADTGLGCGQYDPTGESTSVLGRGEVEVFVSTSTGHRTEWHIDFQENFTLQLSGVKRWTLQPGTIASPLRAVTPHYRSPDSVEAQLKAAYLANPHFEFQYPNASNATGDRQSVLVRPGDVLYFPAGMWHTVEVIEPGVSINISLMATNYAALTTRAIQHLLLKRDEWRESVVMNAKTDVVGKLKSLLQDLPTIIHEFEQNGGAEAIIPPALRQAEARRVDDDDDSESEGGANVEHVIDVTYNDDAPYRCTEAELRDRLRTHQITFNPLASLLREADIYKFYKKDDRVDEDDIYVLNVNYAGNESHESVVRVRIKKVGQILGHVNHCYKAKKYHNVLPPLETWIQQDGERSMLGCLVYYGCLLWVPR